jgi:ATP-dependent helicase/nuclease subunit A
MSSHRPERRRRVPAFASDASAGKLSAASPTSCSAPKAPATGEGPPRAAGRPVRGHPRPAHTGSVRLQADLDEAARETIRTELLTNLLVEAGAGSGKTQMLAERMAAGVATGAYRLEHIAAVTFTRKAASELRGRFHLALEKQLSPSSGSVRLQPDQEARVYAALGNLERFFAGTIHSFCARLLRERPVESGVSPGFTELDEVQDEELRNRAWRDFIANMRAAGDPGMLELLETGVRPKDLESAFATICLNDDVEFPPGAVLAPSESPVAFGFSRTQALKALDKFWTQIEKHLPSGIDDETTCGIQKAARQYRAQLRVTRKYLHRPSVVAELLGTWDCESKIIQKWWADSAAEKKRFKELIEPLHAAFCESVVTPWLAQWRQYVYRLSVGVLARARDHARQERYRRNSLNYSDLLNLAAKVLRENAAVRRALQQKYRHLFVDEFQDTDPVQAEIVFLLAGQDSVGSAFRRTTPDEPADWRTISVRPGSLFVVGDPKQSIYRFRRADIEIYNIVRERFRDPAVGRVVELTRNWRSVPALCEWANEVFATRFPEEPTVHSPRFAPLVPRDGAGTKGAGLFTISHTGESKAAAAADADAIARYIRSEVDAGRRKHSDFLILTRKKKARIAPYASALEALNVPIEVSGAGAFGESDEVAALTVLLRALADPQDQLTLVNVLRGPLFGLSDPELFAYHQAGGWFSIFGGNSGGVRLQADVSGSVRLLDRRSLGEGGQPDPSSSARQPDPAARVATALDTLRQYHRWTRILPAGAALDRILEHTGYLALASTTPGGVEAGDLLHAVDRVRQVVEDGGSLADAADALAADTEASNDVESLPLEPGRTDVVRLMNLHKAKGLEAAVVFLADPCGGVGKWVDVHIERAGTPNPAADGAPSRNVGAGLAPAPGEAGKTAQGWFKVEKKSEGSFAAKPLGEHADWEAHKAAEEPYLTAEEDRLLYVAATRAREMLVVSRFSGSGRRSPAWGVLDDHLSAAKELAIPKAITVAEPRPLTCSAKAQAEYDGARAAAGAAVNQPSWSITSVTAESKLASRMPAAEPAAADDGTRVVAQDTPSHRADAGMAWGTLIHGLLEHAMKFKPSTRDDLRRLALWLTVEEPHLRSVIDQALDTVETVAKAEFWAEAQRHPRSEEAPFAVAKSARLMAGVIDLMYEGAAGWQVIDYKTDRSLDDSRYAAQLEAYRVALRAVGCSVAGTSVFGVRMNPL